MVRHTSPYLIGNWQLQMSYTLFNDWSTTILSTPSRLDTPPADIVWSIEHHESEPTDDYYDFFYQPDPPHYRSVSIVGQDFVWRVHHDTDGTFKFYLHSDYAGERTTSEHTITVQRYS